ncbi:uncharacterized protein [Phyllobates terribilis]|uniref:uncharacterized protein n=1 Tax=Phyllobates terribilis TaxID=111132 RepID=UPI003CCAB8CC
MVRAIKSRKKIKRTTNKASSSAAKKSGPAPAKVWQPGVDKIEDDEELHCDPSAYNSLHAFHVGWPCLSFDIVRDSLGLVRSEFPHSAYFVAGTQANQSPLNSIEIFKLSNISGRKHGTDMDDDSEDSDDSDGEDENGSSTPILQLRRVAHHGCVNRIRSMPQSPHICASWSDSGIVQVWDFSSHLNFLAESEVDSTKVPTTVIKQAPLTAFKHKNEGYAIDWSPCVSGRLVSGDCDNSIHLWEPTSGSKWDVDRTPFVGHTASVEDLQWSPVQENIFASCSVDMKIAIWDIRKGKSPAISFKAHDADVNVISWNRLHNQVLASGSDDGTIKIHDLRILTDGGDSVVAKFEYHKQPITSIEWSPHESSTLAVTSADHQLTVWDLSLERDEEEEAVFRDETEDTVNAPENLPPQLLFVHQGQKDLKELHWHAQIPGMIISTAGDGFNILMPSNIDTPLPPAENA